MIYLRFRWIQNTCEAFKILVRHSKVMEDTDSSDDENNVRKCYIVSNVMSEPCSDEWYGNNHIGTNIYVTFSIDDLEKHLDELGSIINLIWKK